MRGCREWKKQQRVWMWGWGRGRAPAPGYPEVHAEALLEVRQGRAAAASSSA